MADAPVWLVRPPLRCYATLTFRSNRICGERAAWERPSSHQGEPAFFCNTHRLETDSPIADDTLFRRVSVHAELVFGATSVVPASAHAEVVALLEEFLERVGGVLNLHSVRSLVGRAGAWSAARMASASPRKG